MRDNCSWKKREGKSCFVSHYFLIILLKSSRHQFANCNNMGSFLRTKPAVSWSLANIIRPSEIFVAIRVDSVALCALVDDKATHRFNLLGGSV